MLAVCLQDSLAATLVDEGRALEASHNKPAPLSVNVWLDAALACAGQEAGETGEDLSHGGAEGRKRKAQPAAAVVEAAPLAGGGGGGEAAEARTSCQEAD